MTRDDDSIPPDDGQPFDPYYIEPEVSSDDISAEQAAANGRRMRRILVAAAVVTVAIIVIGANDGGSGGSELRTQDEPPGTTTTTIDEDEIVIVAREGDEITSRIDPDGPTTTTAFTDDTESTLPEDDFFDDDEFDDDFLDDEEEEDDDDFFDVRPRTTTRPAPRPPVVTVPRTTTTTVPVPTTSTTTTPTTPVVPPAAPVITGPANGSSINVTTPTFTGTGGDVSTVTVTEGGATICSAVVSGGAWSCTAATSIPDGAHTFTPTATDTAGNSTPGTAVQLTVDTVPPVAPVITGPAAGSITNDTTPTFTGTGEDGSTVTVSEGPTTICSDVVSGGAWSCTPATPRAEEAHSFTPTAKDAAGNSTPGTAVNVTINTAAPVITAPGNGTITNDTTPTFTGTGANGSTVTVSEGVTTICTAAVTGGTWSCMPATPLTAGAHTLTPTAVAAGESTPGSPVTITVGPAITSPANDSTINDTTPTFTGIREVGSTVTVSEGATTICADDSTGATWTCTPETPLVVGQHTFTPRARDVAGNATAGTAVDVTITPP